MFHPSNLAPPAAPSASHARYGARAFVAGWFLIVAVVSASLLARHLVALPRPTYGAALQAALAPLHPTGAASLAVVHVLYAECRCSKLVAEHLLSAPRPTGVVEHVVLVGPDDALVSRLTSRGFLVRVVSEEELAAMGIEAAPTLVIVGPSGEIRYAGGYTERKQALFPRDREILGALRSGEDVAPLPVFGCAVSAQLKRTINPLRLP